MTVKIFGKLVPRTFTNERRFQIFVQESSFDFLPRGMKKPIYKLYLKDILMEKYGPSAFLFPEDKLFPVKNINTGIYDCRLIQYAVIRSLTLRRISSDFNYFYETAIKCFEEHGCGESVKITLVDQDNTDVPLITFLKELDALGGTADIVIPDEPKRTLEDLKKIPHFKKHYKKYKRI